MATAPINIVKTVRKGTATRRAGQQTAQLIVQSAFELLQHDSYKRFSLRGVAEQAGLSLANVQYYFPNLRALLKALFEQIASRYEASYQSICNETDEAALAPMQRFEQIIRFNLRDIQEVQTRKLFFRAWELAGSQDGFTGAWLKPLYDQDIAQLSHAIAEVAPSISPSELRTRATLLAALIEGMMIVISTHNDDKAAFDELVERTIDQAFSIALNEHYSRALTTTADGKKHTD